MPLEVLAAQLNVTECTIGGAVPVPLKVTTTGAFVSFVIAARLPVNVPATDGANFTVTVTLWPAARVTGNVTPLKLNPVPLIVPCEIVRPPLFAVNFTGKETLLPTVTVPNPSEVASAVSVPIGDTPVPLTETLVVALVALLEIVNAPTTAPVVVGENFTENDALCPAASVSGRAGPVTEKPAPVMLAADMVTEPELAVTVTPCEALVPVVTFPKLSEAELTLSDTLAVAPVPESWRDEIVDGTVVTLPDTAPAVVGAKLTAKDTLWPTASVTGKLIPETLKPDPVTFSCVIVVLAVPVFVSDAVCVLLVPSVTVPNAKLD